MLRCVAVAVAAALLGGLFWWWCVGCVRVGGGVYWDCVCVSVSRYVVLCVCGGVNMCACCRHAQGRFECTHRTHNTTQYALSRHTHGQHSTTQHTSHLTHTRPTHCTPTPDAHTETADPLHFHTTPTPKANTHTGNFIYAVTVFHFFRYR